jgi:hypothetical protein
MSVASPLSTGGAGTIYEYRVAAVVLAALLRGDRVIGLEVPGTAVRLQQRIAGSYLDDVIAVADHPDAVRLQVDIQVKRTADPVPSQTGDSDRKGQPMPEAGPSLLRSAFVRAAAGARKQDPQLARIYYLQMTGRGAGHLKACCVVAGHLAERAWTTMNRGTPYVICDNDGNPVTPARARQIIAEKWTVTEEVRKRRRSRAGKAPQAATTGPHRRGDLPRPRSSRHRDQGVKPVT